MCEQLGKYRPRIKRSGADNNSQNHEGLGTIEIVNGDNETSDSALKLLEIRNCLRKKFKGANGEMPIILQRFPF